MKVFYIDIEQFKKNHDEAFLKKYTDKTFKSEKRFYEHSIGRLLIKEAAKKFYNLNDTKIINTSDGKPVFKNSNLNFSISHSKKYAVVCFDTNPCGIDIEFIKPRNLEKLSKYYNQNFSTLENFYKFWTQKEAEYKLHMPVVSTFHTIFKDKYSLCIVSNNSKKLTPEIIEFN